MISLIAKPEIAMECWKGHQWDEPGYLHVREEAGKFPVQRFLPNDRECPDCGGLGAVCFYEQPF